MLLAPRAPWRADGRLQRLPVQRPDGGRGRRSPAPSSSIAAAAMPAHEVRRGDRRAAADRPGDALAGGDRDDRDRRLRRRSFSARPSARRRERASSLLYAAARDAARLAGHRLADGRAGADRCCSPRSTSPALLANPFAGRRRWAWPIAFAAHALVLRLAAPCWPRAGRRTSSMPAASLALAPCSARCSAAPSPRAGATPASAWPWLGWLVVPAALLLLLPRPVGRATSGRCARARRPIADQRRRGPRRRPLALDPGRQRRLRRHRRRRCRTCRSSTRSTSASASRSPRRCSGCAASTGSRPGRWRWPRAPASSG